MGVYDCYFQPSQLHLDGEAMELEDHLLLPFF